MSVNNQVKTLTKPQDTQLENRVRLLVKCPDQPGIVAVLSSFLFNYNANIIESSQYSSDPENGTFFIRIEFHCDNFQAKSEEMKQDFEVIAEDYGMHHKFYHLLKKERTAIFVSKELHCLLELLWEWKNGDLDTEIAVVISNHEDARPIV